MPHKRYSVCGYETNRYSVGYRVYETEKGFYSGFVSDFDGESAASKMGAEELAKILNGDSDAA